jgi:alginate O-acetyltransferase complex protein AlgI
MENLFQMSIVNKKKVSKAYFYARCVVTQVLVILAVIIYSPDHEAVLRIYRGLVHFPSF